MYVSLSDHHITFAFIQSYIKRKISHVKFRDHSEKCLDALKISLNNYNVIYLKPSKRAWMNALSSMKLSHYSVQSYTNYMIHVVESEPR